MKGGGVHGGAYHIHIYVYLSLYLFVYLSLSPGSNPSSLSPSEGQVMLHIPGHRKTHKNWSLNTGACFAKQTPTATWVTACSLPHLLVAGQPYSNLVASTCRVSPEAKQPRTESDSRRGHTPAAHRGSAAGHDPHACLLAVLSSTAACLRFDICRCLMSAGM